MEEVPLANLDKGSYTLPNEKSPLDSNNILDIFFLRWAKPNMEKEEDMTTLLRQMPNLSKEYRYESYSKKINFFLKRMKDRRDKLPKEKQSSLKYFVISLIFQTFKWDIIYITFLSLLFSLFTYVPTYMLQLTLSVPENYHRDDQFSMFITFLSLLLVTRVIDLLMDAYADIKMSLLGNKTSFAITSLVFKKCLRFSFNQNNKYNIGEIINLGTIDATRFSDITNYLLSVITIPFFTGIGLVYLAALVGWALVPGLLFLGVSMTLNAYVVKMSIYFQKGLMKAKAERIKATEEIFNNIKFIKTYVLENFFVNKIVEKRRIELDWLRKSYMRMIYTMANSNFTPNFMLVIIFAVYLMRGGDLTVSFIFTTISVHGTFARSLNMLPNLLGNFVDVVVSSERLANFLLSEEIQMLPNSYDENSGYQIVAENCTWKWTHVPGENANPESKDNKRDNRNTDFKSGPLTESLLIKTDEADKKIATFTISVDELRIKKGELIGVVGKSGSGKSSLLLSFLGELTVEENKNSLFAIGGSKSYLAQRPWIRNCSVRDNIIFGSTFNEEWYDQVLKATCLNEDLVTLKQGDQTMIGDKGINLSGGQKMRVALARALYNKDDIYLLDDPLSALDINVCDEVFRNSIKGLLGDKTRIMTTHNIPYLRHFDRVVMMDKGKIIKIGTFAELSEFPPFIELMDIVKETSLFKDKAGSISGQPQPKSAEIFTMKPSEQLSLESKSNETKTADLELKANPQLGNLEIIGLDQRDLVNMKKEIEEEKESSIKLFFAFIKMGKFYLLFITLVTTFCYIVVFIYKNFYLNEQGQIKPEDFDRKTFLYALIIFETVIFLSQTSRALFNYKLFIGISAKTNTLITYRMLHASINKFYSQNPIGKVLNRLSGDLDILDRSLPMNINMLFMSTSRLFTGIAIILYTSSYYVTIFIIIYFICVIKLQRNFSKTNQQVSRLVTITKTPFFNILGDVVYGVMEIRGGNKEPEMTRSLMATIDLHMRVKLKSSGLRSWFRLYVSLYALIFILPALIFMVLTQENFFLYIGVLLNTVLGMFDSITFFLANLSSLENNLVSFERCQKYMQIEPEEGFGVFHQVEEKLMRGEIETLPVGRRHRTDTDMILIPNENNLPVTYPLSMTLAPVPGKNPPVFFIKGWPEKGVVTFENVFAKYNQKQDWVLKDLNLQIKGGEKIGIIGRTGAGKTSFVNLLNRFFEIMQGTIKIDGVDISTLELKYSRSMISYISQDTYFFEGSLRSNIDPMTIVDDSRMIELLKEAEFWEKVAEDGGLDWKLTNNGSNLSFGEKQILCFLRVMINPKKIVVMDEATSNMDLKSEAILEKMKTKYLHGMTTFTIAHRLNTVYQSDKILILEKGQVKTFSSLNDLSDEDMSFFQKYAENLIS